MTRSRRDSKNKIQMVYAIRFCFLLLNFVENVERFTPSFYILQICILASVEIHNSELLAGKLPRKSHDSILV